MLTPIWHQYVSLKSMSPAKACNFSTKPLNTLSHQNGLIKHPHLYRNKSSTRDSDFFMHWNRESAMGWDPGTQPSMRGERQEGRQEWETGFSWNQTKRMSHPKTNSVERAGFEEKHDHEKTDIQSWQWLQIQILAVVPDVLFWHIKIIGLVNKYITWWFQHQKMSWMWECVITNLWLHTELSLHHVFLNATIVQSLFTHPSAWH